MILNRTRKRRLYQLLALLLGMSLATGLILYALQQNINVFVTPSELNNTSNSNQFRVRLGGVVKMGSVHHDTRDLGVNFIVTDFQHEILVRYHGILPDLFKEGKGVITEGMLSPQHIFIAQRVLAKHDENYRPKQHGPTLREKT